MYSKTNNIVKGCLLCQAATPQYVREPLEMSPLPEYAWGKASIFVISEMNMQLS